MPVNTTISGKRTQLNRWRKRSQIVGKLDGAVFPNSREKNISERSRQPIDAEERVNKIKA